MGVGDDVAPRFTQKPALKQEDGGKRLVFHSVLEASPQPEVFWFQGTTPLTPSDHIRMRVESAGGSAYNVIMEIIGVTQGDAGTYKVTAKNRLGEVSASINLNFGGQKQQEGVAPNFIQKPVTKQADNGQKLIFECMLTADPAPTITWFKDNAAIPPGGRYSMRADPRDKKTYFLAMEINGVNAQDAGNYKVTAKNSLGESNATIRLNFDASMVTDMKGVRPVFLQKPAIRQVGENIVLECKLTAEPKPQVSWIFNNQAISFGPGGRLTPTLVSDGATHTLTLEIAQVSMSDAGEYRAIAKNDVGEATATITLNFEGAKKPELPAGKAPHFRQKPTIKQQQNLLIMTCLLEANPTPQIRWFRDTTEVGAGGRYNITLERDASGPDQYIAVLKITDPKVEDGGTYKCTAANNMGESNATITLNFAGAQKAKPPGGVAPAFTEKPKVSQDPSGKNIIITCQCTGSPAPNITWFKGANQLQPSARVVPTVKEEGGKYTLKLEILNFTVEDGGQYKVTAKNEMGEGSASISINLEPPKEAPPQPQGKPTIRLDKDGTMIVIQQALSCASQPTCVWNFGNQVISQGGRLVQEVIKEGNLYYVVLRIPNFTDADSGTYKVVMKTKGGEATSTAAVNVEALRPKPKGTGPQVVQKLMPQVVTSGEKVEFVIKVSGTEPLNIQWTRNGQVITSSARYSISYDKGTCRLHIPAAAPEDSGNYGISLKNEWGTASSTASLQVKEKPKEEPKPEEPKPAEKSKMEITMESKAEMQMTPQQQGMQIQVESKKQAEPEPPKPEPPKPEPPKKEPEPPKPEPPKPEPPKKEPEPPKPEPPKPEPPKKEPEPAKKPEPPKPEPPKKKEPEPPKPEPPKPEPPKKEPEPAKKPEPPKPEPPKKEPEPAKKPEPPKPEPPKKKEPEPPKPEPPKKKEPEPAKKPEPPKPEPKKPEKKEEKKDVPQVKVEDTGKVSVDKGAPTKPAPGEGPLFKQKPTNQVIMEGETMKLDVEVQLDGKPMPNVRYLRAGREIREDSRVTIKTMADRAKSTLTIKKAKYTDEAKYTINLEQDGVITDSATFSLFVKDPKDSNLDFRSLLKHRESKKKQEEEEDPDWGSLKPVEKGRKMSDADSKIQLKKVEKPEAEPEDAKKGGSRRGSTEPEMHTLKVDPDKLEAMEQQRRNSLSQRRPSLMEVIPDWPTLHKAPVQKEEPDKFIKDLEDVKAMEGDRVEFKAEFCKPEAKLKWYKNKLEIFHGHKYHFENDDTEYRLVIPEAKPEDGGKVTIECNGVQSSAWLYVEAKPTEYTFTKRLPEQYEIKRKKTGMLECFVSDPRAFVKWFRNGQPLEYTPGKYEIQRRENRCILKILDAQKGDEAEYTCKCGEATTSCKLKVGEPEWEFVKPLDDVEAVEREKALMECDVSDPDAEVTWLRGDKELKSGGKYEFQKDGLKRRLQIKNCSSKDDGKYTCKVLDQTTTADLYVSPDVKFIKKLANKKCKEKEQIVLDAKAANPHKHPVKWLKDGKPIPDTVRFDVSQKGEIYKLTIKDTDFGDSGEYSLQIGERATRATLAVEPTPRPPKIDASKVPKEILVKKGENIDVEIPYDGAPVPRAKWSKNGEPINEANLDTETVPKCTKLRIPGAQTSDNGQYELTLTNDAGSDKVPIKITVMGPPSPPKGPLDVLDVFCDRCALMWDKPAEDGGSPVLHYVVEKCDQETGDWEKLCETKDLEVDVPDLITGHKYQFRVSAVNAEGASDFLKSDGAVLAKDPWDPTSPPGEPKIIDYDKDYAELEFSPPKEENGAPVEGYVIEYREKGTKDWKKGVETTSADNKGTVDGLTEGKEYEFRVMAKNKAGLSEPSTVSPSVLTRSRKVKPRIDHPSVPKNIRIKVGQPFTIPVKYVGEPAPTVTWKAKNLDTTKGKKGEDVEVTPTDTLEIQNEPGETVINCKSGLRKDTGEYTITVANKHGSDSATIEVVVLGPPGKPGGPLEAKNITKDNLTLQWAPSGDDGGSEITGYRVEKLDLMKGTWEKVAETTGNKCQVPKLQENHEYKFRVFAVTKAGDSEPLEIDNHIIAKRPFDEPHPPSQPEVVDRDRNFIELKWEPPSKDGGAPITGYDIERKDPKTKKWVKINKRPIQDCQFKDDRVKENGEYQYRVIANNEAGPSDPSLETKPIVARPVKETPKLNLDSLFGAKDIRVRAGEPINLELGISGTPDPTVEWLKDGVPVGNRAQTQTDGKSTRLNVAKAERGDTGRYTIRVENPHGHDSADVNIIVLDKPSAPEGPIVASDILADQLKLTWNPPKETGGAEISGYVVEKQEEGSNVWEKVPGIVSGTSHTVKGLKDGKGYKFRVKAENIYGTGEPLEGEKVIAKNPFDTPDAPRDLEMPKYDRRSATLTWKPPLNDGGNKIKGYEVEKKDRRGEWEKVNTYPITDTQYTVLNLKEGSEVEFRVRAVNDGGPGEPSKHTPPHVVRDQVFQAGAPSQPNVDKITKNSVDLSWHKPTNDGGGKLSGYVVERKKKGEDEWEECSVVPPNATSATISGLPEGEEFQFRVRAENAAGLGEPSKPTNTVTVVDQPERPKLDLSRVKDITVKAGQDFKIAIPFKGTPKPTAKWELNGNDLDKSPHAAEKLTDTEVGLEVTKAKRADAGKYSVTLRNDSGSETGHINVNVLDKPQAPGGPIEPSEMDGESMTLSWQPPQDDGGEPVANYIVEKRKAGHPKWTKVSSFCHSPKCQVRNLEPGTKYEFRVLAENSQGISEPLETSEAILSKLPYDAPQAPSTPKLAATTEDSITLTWDAPRKDGGSPIKGYVLEKREKGDKKWTKANVQDILDTEFTVKNLKMDKGYEFRVAAVNKAGVGEFSDETGTLKPAPPPVAPRIGRDMMGAGKDIKVKVGDEFKINIPFTANPTPTAAWSQGGLSLQASDRFTMDTQADKAVLVCRKAEKGDSSRYTVTLHNDKGQDSASVNVTVFDVPTAPEGPLDISNITPDSCVLKWSPPVDDGGSPISNYVVEKQDLKSGRWEPVSKFVRNPTYEVMGLTEGHEYNFRVMAENEFGASEPLDSAYSIAAQHPYTAPEAPDLPKVDDIDEDSVTLRWNKPKSDGGKKIQGYVIEYKEPSSNRWKPFNEAPINDTKATVNGLKKDAEYEFRVRAKNVAGLGTASEATGPVHVKPKYTKPGSPSVPEPVKVGKTYVDLKWDKPRNDGGSKIKGYVVERREKGMSSWLKAKDVPATDTTCTVDNLAENAEYEFRVMAVNAAGPGEPSLATAPIKIKEKLEGHAPDFLKKLHNVKGVLGGEASFVVEYSGQPKPEVLCCLPDAVFHMLVIMCELVNPLGRESCKAKLEVQVPPKVDADVRDQKVQKGDQFKIKVPFSGTGPFEFKVKCNGKEVKESDRIKISPFDDYVAIIIKDTDLEDSGKYEVEVSNDSGAATTKFNLKVCSAPGSPLGPLAVSDVTKSSCKLAWKPPKVDGGARVTGYHVERQEVGKPYWVTVMSNCKDTNLDIQGLYDDHQYLFRVAANNENGTGDFLETESAIVAKMPFDAPEAPGLPEVTEVGGNFVSLSWEKPKSDGGGRITGYWIEKREHGADLWSRVNQNPCTTNLFNIPSLIEDKRYEFRVFAENEAGMSKPSMASNSVKIKDPNAAVVPEFHAGLRKIAAVEGKTARFECEVSGQPPPDVVWYKGSRELTDGNKYEILKEGDKYILVVHDVYGEDADEYSVRASNKGGNRVSRAELEISSAPKINVPPRFKDVCTFEKGEHVTMKIPFTGNPKPSVKWIRDGEELRGSRFHHEVTDRHALLTIKDASKEDDGPYRLTLENNLGSDTAVIKIQINDRPDPPRFPVMENIRDDSVVLSWKPPLNDGGSFITAYIVEKKEVPSGNWLRVASTRFAFHNITGLSPGKEYLFRVKAENFYGVSDPCETTEPVKTEDAEEMKKKKQLEDEQGRKVRGKYDGPKINDYDKFFENLWKKYVPQPVEIQTGSVYDYYDILEELGSGAFGVVHRCVEKKTGRVFVAKFINTPFPLDKHTVKNEVSIMNHLHHPKLINLHDAFEDKHEMVLILEFLAGGELFDRIAAEDYKMSEAEVINYMRQVCEAVKHMHENSIVHLDIKPENIMCETNRATNVKLIDFGLASKLNPDEVIKVTTATAEFAAPEIVERDAVGFYTDMWAVGVLAYVLLSGLSPFAGEDDLETLQNVKRCDWEFDQEAFSSVSTEGKDFIKSLLIRQPQKRLTVYEALEHPWLLGDHSDLTHRIPSSRYNKIRQKIKDKYADWPHPMPAIGRIANFSSLRKQRPKEFAIFDTYFDRKEAAPRFVRRLRNQVAAEGNTAKFDCKIVAASAPIITWFKADAQLSQSYKHMQKYHGKEYELRISRIKMDDKGEYSVRAENSFGRKEEKATLTVEAGLEVPKAESRDVTPRKKRVFEELPIEKPVEDCVPSFGFGLRPRFIQAGSEFKLICNVMAHPVPKVTWTKDGRDITENDHYNITYAHGSCTLEVAYSKPEDSGTYVCRAVNSLGEQETSCMVTVEARAFYKPKDSSHASSNVSRMVRRTTSGTRVEESSSYSSSSRTSRRTERTEDFSSSSRTERKTVTSDTSSSTIVSSSTSTSDKRSEEEAPQFTENLSPVEVVEGESLTLSCAFTGLPEPNIEWFFNGQMLSSDDIVSIKTRGSSSRLQISEVVVDDEGDYVCKASNTAGVASTKANVVVKVAKKKVEEQPEEEAAPPAPPAEDRGAPVDPPRFLDHLQGQSVTDGDQVTLQCRISGKPEVQWLANGNPLTDSDDFKFQNAGDIYKLVIGEIFPDDGGVYACKATNAGGSALSSCTVFVAVPDEEPSDPVFSRWPQSQNIDEGSPVTFTCTLDSPSALTVSWSKDGRAIDADTGRFKLGEEGKEYSLTIPAALSTDSGTYCVTATSQEGKASWSCTLAVAIGDSGDEAKVQQLLQEVE
ncbi:twitchin-like [Babylonia areolata]|uniref:twitchin-like n=1 Tax=Babylonia areolata TaxID=304850 RepID=UPI003FD37D99